MRRVVLLLAAAGAIACAGESTAPTPRTVSGIYGLTTVNGALMPLLLDQNDTAKLELLSGAVTLRDDASFIDVLTLRLTQPSGVLIEGDTIVGTYVHSGTTLMFQRGDGTGNYFMTVTDEHTLTETDPGLLIVYRRD